MFKKLILLALLGLSSNLYSAQRTLDKGAYPMVGRFSYRQISCALFMAHPGILVTAKHCFTHHDVDPDNIQLEYLRANFQDEQNNKILLYGHQIKELVFDSGENDIAYLIFDPKEIEIEINFKNLNVELNPIPNEIEILHVGYPSGNERVVSFDCQFSGETSYFEPRITDPGYEGILLNTSCPAWYGDSGGPVFSIDENKKIQIWGVLTHTFDVDMFGDLLEDQISEDHIGQYVMTSMFSPFSETTNFQDLVDRLIE
jgi:hypothetical protein